LLTWPQTALLGQGDRCGLDDLRLSLRAPALPLDADSLAEPVDEIRQRRRRRWSADRSVASPAHPIRRVPGSSPGRAPIEGEGLQKGQPLAGCFGDTTFTAFTGFLSAGGGNGNEVPSAPSVRQRSTMSNVWLTQAERKTARSLHG